MEPEKSLSYYFNEAESLNSINFKNKIKIALLSSFTINGLSEVLTVKCAHKNIDSKIYVGGYSQHNQEILNKDSELYAFKPDITFLLIDIRNMLGNLFFFPYSISNSERKIFVNQKLSEIMNLITSYQKNSSSKLIISNFNIPIYSPFGIAESQDQFGFHEMIQTFNLKLQENLLHLESVYLYDFDQFVRKFGENNIFNYRNFFFGDVKIELNCLPYLGNEFFSYIIAHLGLSKKCIVLDLDNTLWGGIIGEDGFDGIHLGLTPPGNVFHEFQSHLKSLSDRGIILAINSKNNFNDAIRVIREHPHMVLKENDFACMIINWENKVDNMKAISNQLNIGLDSIVFFDDDPVNREFMRKNLPEVTTPELSSDSSELSKTLLDMNDFSTFKITDDDLQRSKTYSEQKKRIELEKSTTNLDDFLNSLDMKLTIKKATSFTIPRISQLTLKTNQFNLTTKRYQEKKIKELVENSHMLVECIQVEDKFGDNGITGVYIINKDNPKEWELDTFLLSCRVMGREIEKGIMNYIINIAKKNNVEKIKAKYIPTEKNQPIEKFLKSCNFEKIDDYWIFQLNKSFKNPNFLKLTVE